MIGGAYSRIIPVSHTGRLRIPDLTRIYQSTLAQHVSLPRCRLMHPQNLRAVRLNRLSPNDYGRGPKIMGGGSSRINKLTAVIGYHVLF